MMTTKIPSLMKQVPADNATVTLHLSNPSQSTLMPILVNPTMKFGDLKAAVASMFGVTTVSIFHDRVDLTQVPPHLPIKRKLKHDDVIRVVAQGQSFAGDQTTTTVVRSAPYDEWYSHSIYTPEQAAGRVVDSKPVAAQEQSLLFNDELQSYPSPGLFTGFEASAIDTSTMSLVSDIPLNDYIGSIVCSGTISQYFLDGGRSACTSICLLAAKMLLTTEKRVASLDSTEIDSLVRLGVSLHFGSLQHSSVDELWSLPCFVQTVDSIARCETLQGVLTPQRGFEVALDHAERWINGSQDEKVALVLTKSGESVLCFFSEKTWFLFDSHGQSHEDQKKAYIKRFNSKQELVRGLLVKYPRQDFGDGSVQSEMYNMYEAHPIITQGWHLVSPPESPVVCQRTQADSDNKLANELKGEDNVCEQSVLDISDLLPTPSLSVKASATIPLSTQPFSSQLLDLSDFEDPLLYCIMADPVNCEDGYCYDRDVIERVFRDRITAEEARRNQEDVRERGEASDTDPSDPVCCGSRPPIEIVSPMTGKKLYSTNLVPNRTIERQIVRHVAHSSNPLGLTAAEIEDWNRRRENKIKTERERRERERLQEKKAAEMQATAAKATERRRAEQADATSAKSALDIPLKQVVRVDRDIRQPCEKLCDKDTGLSVALCKPIDRVSPDYLQTNGGQSRCMVGCCGKSLNKHSSCPRCGRAVCQSCLCFIVTDAEEASTHRNQTSVCPDCVSQIVDAIDPNETKQGQIRAIIQRLYLSNKIEKLIDEAAEAQDSVVQSEVRDEFQSRLGGINAEIRQLEQRRSELGLTIQNVNNSAKDTRTDDNDGNESATLELLISRVGSLRGELTAIQEQDPPDNEEEQILFVTRREQISEQLYQAEIELAGAMDLLDDPTKAPNNFVDADSANDPPGQLAGEHAQSQQMRFKSERSQNGNTQAEVSVDPITPVDDLIYVLDRHPLCSKGIWKKRLERKVTKCLQTLRQLRLQLQEGNVGVIPRFLECIESLPRGIKLLCEPEILRVGTALRAKSATGDDEAPTTDIVTEYLGLLSVNVTDLSDTEQLNHALRVSELQSVFQVAEEDALVSSKAAAAAAATLPPTPLAAVSIASDIKGRNQKLTGDAPANTGISGSASEPLSVFDGMAREVGLGFLLPQTSDIEDHVSVELAPQTLEESRARLEAIGYQKDDWKLPLGLEFPTSRMDRSIEYLQNALKLRRIDSQRSWENIFTMEADNLDRYRNALEDEIQRLEGELHVAKEAEENRREERRRLREEERRQREEARIERERQRKAQEEKARAEAQALRNRIEQEETATREVFSAHQGQNNAGADAFGGNGALRMCGRCKAGPIENMACDNLATHNNTQIKYYGQVVTSVQNPNNCPACGWHSANWNDWPYWDGEFGPH